MLRPPHYYLDMYLLWVLLNTVHFCGLVKGYDCQSVRTCCYICSASHQRGAEPSDVCQAVLVYASWQESCLQKRLDAPQPVLYACRPNVKHQKLTLGSLMDTNIAFTRGTLNSCWLEWHPFDQRRTVLHIS